MWMKKVVDVTARACGNCFGVLSGAGTEFDQIYVFGDSLSDIGNVSDTTRGDIPQAHPTFKDVIPMVQFG